MIDLLLDPEAALDAVNKAVSLVKKASATASSIESLAPALGKYFDAKASAIASAEAAKAGTFGNSAMGKAFELEMAIESQREFEEDLKRLFWNANKMDVWMRIKARASHMEAEAAKAAGRAKEEARRKKKKQQEENELAIAVILTLIIAIGLIWGGWELFSYCIQNGCG
jgi:cation transport ATPase